MVDSFSDKSTEFVILITIYAAIADNRNAENQLKLETILKLERMTNDWRVECFSTKQEFEREDGLRKIYDEWHVRLQRSFEVHSKK